MGLSLPLAQLYFHLLPGKLYLIPQFDFTNHPVSPEGLMLLFMDICGCITASLSVLLKVKIGIPKCLLLFMVHCYSVKEIQMDFG